METAGSRSKASEGSRWFGFRSQWVQDGLRELGCAENKVINSSCRVMAFAFQTNRFAFLSLLFCTSCDSDIFPSHPNFVELLGKKTERESN